MKTLLILFFAVLTSFGRVAGAAPAWSVSTNEAALSVLPGQTVTISASVTAGANVPSAQIIFTPMASGPSPAAVAPILIAGQTLVAGQTYAYNFQFTVPFGVLPGSYNGILQVASSDWSSSYIWKDPFVTTKVRANPAQWQGGMTPANLNVSPGQVVNVSATILAGANVSNVMVNFGVTTTGSSSYVAYQSLTGQNMTSGQNYTYNFSLTIPSNLPLGSTFNGYLQVASADWSIDYLWSPSMTLNIQDQILALSGNSQIQDAGQAVSQPLTVYVQNLAGEAVQGAAVNWNVVSGGGSVSNASSVTDVNGQAEVQFTLGSGGGVNQVVASIAGAPGSSVTFSEEGVGNVSITTNQTSVIANASNAATITVAASTVSGAPIPGIPFAPSVSCSPSSATPAVLVPTIAGQNSTNSSGQVQFSLTASTAESCTVSVSSPVSATSPVINFVANTPAFNIKKGIGINLGPNMLSQESIPFINAFLWSNPWGSNINAPLNLDENGWIKSLNPAVPATKTTPAIPAQTAAVFMFSTWNANGGHYPAGTYTVLYEGSGTLTFAGDATLVSQSAGQYLIKVTKPTGNGIVITETATNPSNYLRNIQVLLPCYAAGTCTYNPAKYQIFNPDYLSFLAPFQWIRYIGWSSVNQKIETCSPSDPQTKTYPELNGIQSTCTYGVYYPQPAYQWSSRKQPTYATQATANAWAYAPTNGGVALEYQVALSNAVGASGASPYFNIPLLASDDYVTQMATYVHNNLKPNLTPVIEVSNEVWNGLGSAGDYGYSNAAGNSAGLGQASDGGDYGLAGQRWYTQRALHIFDVWNQVWGNDSVRTVHTISSQTAWPWESTVILGQAQQQGKIATIDAYNVGGYISTAALNAVQPASSSASDIASAAAAADALIQKNGNVNSVVTVMNANITDQTSGLAAQWGTSTGNAGYIEKYNTPDHTIQMIMYEGGQSMDTSSYNFLMGGKYNSDYYTMQSVFSEVNSMLPNPSTGYVGIYGVYQNLITTWTNNGGGLMFFFQDIAPAPDEGYWGTLQYLGQPVNSSPKYNAMLWGIEQESSK